MKTKFFTGLLMFFAVFLSTSASAVSIGFEGMVANQSTPYIESGYSIFAPDEHLHGFFDPVNFDTNVQMANDTKGTEFWKNDFGLFDLISLEVTNVFGLDKTTGTFGIQIDGLIGGAVQVSKQLASGTTGTINFLSDNASWGAIDEVQFWYESQGSYGNLSTFLGDDFKFDNLVVVEASAVPVPAAAWLFFSALGGLGILRRKQAIT